MTVAILVLLAVGVLVRSELARHRADAAHRLEAEVTALAAGLERSVATRATLADALAAFVTSDPDFTSAEFTSFASALVSRQPDVRAVQLVPDGVIRHIHPLAGNEGALGLDLLGDAGQREVVRRTIDQPGYVIGGPVELVQGGTGIIARLSIAETGTGPADATPGWWGLAAVVMDLDVVLADAGFPEGTVGDRYELRGVDGLGAAGARFAGVDLTGRDPLSTTVDLPGGEWHLSAVPADGWSAWSSAAVLLLGGGVLLAGLAAGLTWQLAAAPRRLRGRIETATVEAATTAAYLRAVMNAASEAILAVDRSGMIVGTNPAALELLSGGAELRGRAITEVVPGGVEQLASDGNATPTRIDATRLDGSSFAGEVTATRTADDRLLTVVLRDVTDRERAQAAIAASSAELVRHAGELERLNRELTRVDEVKRDFVAMASHEMRTPVTAVQGFAVTLQRHWREMDDAARALSVAAIHRQSQRLWQVVSDLLVASEIETGDIHASLVARDVPTLVRQRCDAAGLTGSDVTIEAPPGLVVDLPEAHVERILDALLSNAGKYGRPPVHFRVTTSTDDLTIRIQDAGAGIPEEFRAELFKRFSQASTGERRTARGTGLGLAVARGLARAHGGDVVHLPDQPGACFEIRLPLHGPARTSAGARADARADGVEATTPAGG
ncbi:MAG: CHASE domain-containing protein, partial [Actinobacteria bacterium]|nr:CHASE domain-containing protein [Actinomycetota bacterium]